MLVEDRFVPPAMAQVVLDAVSADIRGALGDISTAAGKFVVNDSRWLKLRSDAAPAVTVMNSAKFISGTFQARLRASGRNWETNHKIRTVLSEPAPPPPDAAVVEALEAAVDDLKGEDQEIDAYKEFSLPVQGYTLDDDGLRRLLDEYWRDKNQLRPLVAGHWPFVKEPSLDQVAFWLTHMYQRRSIHDVSVFPNHFHAFFRPTSEPTQSVRVGIEFETGYTASAYRAFLKLNLLYTLGLIDLGVFIATDRANAVRIWPASTRNVNYDELENRQYRRTILLPMWEMVFRPDSYSAAAPYLAADGTTYTPTPTASTKTHGGVKNVVYTVGKKRIIPA